MLRMSSRLLSSIRLVWAPAAVAAALATAPALAQERVVKIYGFGAKSGVVGIFGQQSEAAMQAAAALINSAGGVTMGDGSKARLVIEYLDDRCTAEEGINALRRITSQNDAVVAIGPTCSNVAEPVFGILQKKAGDASDSGLQFPLYTDVAAKGGLAALSEWSFRNVPSEANMYKSVFEWIKATRPDLKTFWGGVEKDFAHSNATYGVIKTQAGAQGIEVKGQSEWLLNDTNFSNQVREMKRERLDAFARVVALSLRCHKVRFLYFPPPPHLPRQPPRTHEDGWVRAYPAGRARKRTRKASF